MSIVGGQRNSGSTGPAAMPTGASMKASVMIGSKPTLISSPPMRFLIMDAPRQSNLHLYIKECRRHHVTDIVRVCEPTYLGAELQSAGIELHEMAYEDGHSPPKDVLERWLKLVDDRFFQGKKSETATSKGAVVGGASGGSDGTTASSSSAPAASSLAAVSSTSSTPTIAVHCVAGLGRAPVLVAIALMEFASTDAVEAVTMIRKSRRGSINEKQLNYLESYRPQYRRANAGCACTIL